jgi:ubiquinone/menaquinone biosynthesis C-methylase UbiE
LYINLADPDNWELIVNKQTGQWGLTYDKAQDLGRVKMTMTKPAAPIENLKFSLADLGGGSGKLTLEWENYSASVPLAAH